MVLELAVLHVFDKRQVELWHIVLVHIQQNVPYHHNALLDLLPDAVKLAQELLIVVQLDVLCYWLQQMDCGLFDSVVEHLTVLVEH